MISKAEVKSILSRRLSGREAGRLWIQDSWEVDRGREGFLSEADHRRIRKSMTSEQDIADFNSALDLYRGLEWLVKDAQIACLQASYLLERISNVGDLYAINALAISTLRSVPLIVTEKQLRGLKAKQRQKKLRRLYCLDQVVTYQAYHLAPAEFKARCSLADYLYGSEAGPDEDEIPDRERVYREAEAQVQELVESGKLTPQGQAVKPYDRLRTDSHNIESWPPAGEEPCSGNDSLLSLYVSGGELVKARLPGWREAIEEFELWEIDREDWYADEPPECIALVRPEAAMRLPLDKRGHYKPDFLDGFSDITQVRQHSVSLEERHQEYLKDAKDRILKLIARRQVLREARPLVGVNTTEDVDKFYEDLAKRIDSYNAMAGSVSPRIKKLIEEHGKEAPIPADQREDLREGLEAELEELTAATAYGIMILRAGGAHLIDLPRIDLEKLKPPAADLSYGRSVLDYGLGPKWWLLAAESEEDLDYGEE